MTVSTTELIQSCSYWNLPEDERQALIDDTPKVPTWDLELQRGPTYWYFDRPDLKTYKELLVGGTEKIIDNYYQYHFDAEPREGVSMTVRVSTEELQSSDGMLVQVPETLEEDGSADFIDWHTQLRGWLCPWTQLIWGYTPDHIHIQIINS